MLASALCAAALLAATAQQPAAPAAAAPTPTVPAATAQDVKLHGAFAFPQKDAKVLCDTPELRLSAWSAEYLYIQALLPTDTDDTVGETDDGRAIGDGATLIFDADADGKPTAKVDRYYSLNPWPQLPGLHYQIIEGASMSSGLTGDSKGRGCVSYVGEGAKGGRVRVDSFLIPLAEIKHAPLDTVRFAYWGSSPKPALTVNSVGFKSDKKYYSHSLPWKDFHSFELSLGVPAEHGAGPIVKFDDQQVPEGRTQIAVLQKDAKPVPAVGAEPPDIAAATWINWKGDAPPSLKSLRGKVVVVEFWATWCGPCVAGIPHLNQLHDDLASKGLVILSLTDQANKAYIEDFLTKKPMHYTVGIGSQAINDYGINGIPHAFVIGKDGKLAWHGHPSEDGFDTSVKAQLEAR